MSTLFEMPHTPPRVIRAGVVYLPGFLDVDTQRTLVDTARDLARAQQGTPFAMQRRAVKSGVMSAYLMSLGAHWDYARKTYVRTLHGHRVLEAPALLTRTAQHILTAAGEYDEHLAPWVGKMQCEATLVNYYPPGAGMGMHQDLYETSSAPVISISIGDSALFRAGNNDHRGAPWDDVWLHSGDALVFGGPARTMFHGVMKLEPHTAPADCGVTEGRINMTFRQIAHGNVGGPL